MPPLMRCSLWLYSPNVTGKELLAICRGGACACLCAPLLCSSPTRRDLPAGPATPAWLLADDLASNRLVQLAPKWQAHALPVYLLYPRAQHYPSRLLRFIALMREAVSVATQEA